MVHTRSNQAGRHALHNMQREQVMPQTIEEYERRQAEAERLQEMFEESVVFDKLVTEWIDDLRQSVEYFDALDEFERDLDQRP